MKQAEILEKLEGLLRETEEAGVEISVLTDYINSRHKDL